MAPPMLPTTNMGASALRGILCIPTMGPGMVIFYYQIFKKGREGGEVKEGGRMKRKRRKGGRK